MTQLVQHGASSAPYVRVIAAGRSVLHTLSFLLPERIALPEDAWRRRHRAVVVLLWIHVVVIFAASWYGQRDLVHATAEGSIVAALAALASLTTRSHRFRASMASLGLVTASGVLVHVSGGMIEFHFHFFVAVIVISLYQDWVPFLLAITFVVLHHGVIGILDPTGVYNHPDAIAHPWKWALIHGAFIFAASIASVVNWRLNESARKAVLVRTEENGRLVEQLSRDIAERERAEAERVAVEAARYREVKLLLDIGQSLLHTQDLTTFLEDSIDGIIASGEYDVAAIRLTDPSESEDEFAVTRDSRARHEPAITPATGGPVGKPWWPPVELLPTHEPAVFADLAKEPRLDSLQREGIVSAVFVPVRTETTLLGHLVLGCRIPRPVSTGEMRLLATIGGQIGVAAQKARLYEATQKANERREHAEEQLRQAQKMEAVGQLAGGIAHDFNNLLTVINGFTELTYASFADGDARREPLAEVLKAGERAAGLTSQLLAFSRRQMLRAEVLDLNAVVADTDKLLRRLIGEDIELHISLARGLGRVKADRGQLGQVILNLAANARDAMPTGGVLTIETANVEFESTLGDGNSMVKSGAYVMLAVSDTGCGMDAATQARIFEPFYTTKEQGKGTGLGLSTVYGIVKQSEGDVLVYSEPGTGTTFKIYLRRYAAIDELPVTPNVARQAPGGSETVLIAEDEPGVRRLAAAVLESVGYTVLIASQAAEAIEVALQHHGPIDLLLTDIVMPGLSGRELAQRLRHLRPGVKVLYMSGYTPDVAVRHGVLEATMAYLQKPFTPVALAQRVREVLEAEEPMVTTQPGRTVNV
ncbi:MAG: hypothetical protein QOF51_1059 [Chloroflexota bacterium]|jgi:signal transduction histidine kinase/CheY-like chemotaxis protein|nr:hypothetical protein [Chloroflexota bacterium]